MPYLILGVGLAVGLFLVSRWFVSAKPEQVRKALIWVGACALVAVAGFFLFTGRAPVGLGILLAPLLMGLRAFVFRPRGLGRARRPRGGRASQVRTRYLDMVLDHDTGSLDGTVIAGSFQGQRLSALSRDALVSLLGEVGSDPQSVQLLEAYLDRVHGPEWRGGGSAGAGPSGGRMTEEEARDILGVEAGASDEEIEVAYRAAMKRNHPDAGGSGWLAARINEAKALLLKR